MAIVMEQAPSRGLAPVENLINGLLAGTPHLEEGLAGFAGKSLAIAVQRPRVEVTVTFRKGAVGLAVSDGESRHPDDAVAPRDGFATGSDGSVAPSGARPEGMQRAEGSSARFRRPDARLEGRLADLLGLLRPADPPRPVADGSVAVSGDILFVQELRRVLVKVDWHWLDVLAPALGDGPAEAVAALAAGIRQHAGEARRSLQRNLRDYVTEEINGFVAGEEMPSLRAGYGELRLRIDRLAARAAALRGALGK